MSASRRLSLSIAWLVYIATLLASSAHADQLVYVPLAQPCRLLDTRISTGGQGPLTQTHGAYLFGVFDDDIKNASQHGSATGCGIPTAVEAVSINMNLLNATAAGNIVTWSADAGSTAPNIGTAVYNPTAASPMAGQVQYNTGYTTVPVGTSSPGKFYLQIANGQIDMTINAVGYWLPISWEEIRSGSRANALGFQATATGVDSTAIGYQAHAEGGSSMALGALTQAKGNNSTATGVGTIASGSDSTAMGNTTVASGFASTAMGGFTEAGGDYSIAMGNNVTTGGHNGSFIFGDAYGFPSSPRTPARNTADNQFLVVASGGVYLFTSPERTSGAGLSPGSGTWTTLSDRNAKTAVRSVDAREVLKKVVTLPLNTWQYKTQDAKYRHIGPMAQDFYAAFQLGESDKGIDTVDADGVALAAIQGLHAELIEKDREIASLHAEMKSKDAQLAGLQARISSLESSTADMAEMKAQIAALRHSTPAPVSVALQP